MCDRCIPAFTKKVGFWEYPLLAVIPAQYVQVSLALLLDHTTKSQVEGKTSEDMESEARSTMNGGPPEVSEGAELTAWRVF